jgi:hypothetical protein
MSKSRKVNRKKTKFLKKIRKATKKAVPIISDGLKTIGSTTKTVVKQSAPIVEKGVAGVYNTLATGFDMGIKGAKTVVNGIQKSKNRTRHHRK